MSFRWVSLNEAVGILGISISTLRRRIDAGQLESKVENGRRLVQVSGEIQASSKSNPTFIDELLIENARLEEKIERHKEQTHQQDTRIKELELRIKEKDEQISTLQKEIDNSKELIDQYHNEISQAKEKTSLVEPLRENKENLERQMIQLRKKLDEKDEDLRRKDKQIAEASHRHDTVVMQMTKLLEYHQQPFWRKLFSRKALQPRVDETIIDAKSAESDNVQEN